MTKVGEFAALDLDELESRLEESRRELLNLRFQLATGQLDNSARINLIRRDVARILTLLREREIAEEEGTEVPFRPVPVARPRRARAGVDDEEEFVGTDEEFDDEVDEES
ncbi:MAG TPA: 50S ribosomal protein L29 [Candidatus Acidoferrales bacterium]|nr:50S ribosomal protein L29 [Candidatus Acidoferrales bacterium]